MKYAWTAEHKACWPITLTCDLLGSATAATLSIAGERALSSPVNQELSGALATNPCWCTSKPFIPRSSKYGWTELRARGLRLGKERVRKLMQRHSIYARGKVKFVVITDSEHDLPIAPNLFARDFSPAAPDMTWISDITYIATDEGLVVPDGGH